MGLRHPRENIHLPPDPLDAGFGHGGVLHGSHLNGYRRPSPGPSKGACFRDRNSTGGHLYRTVDTFGESLSMYLGTGHGRFTFHNELEDLFDCVVLLVKKNACRQTMYLFSSAINPGRREAWHTAQRKAAKQHRGGIICDLFIRALYLPSRKADFVDQRYDWKTIDMTPKCYRGPVARGHAADIRAAEVPMDYEAKARKTDHEFKGVEHVRNGPPGPPMASPLMIGLVVRARGGLSRSVRLFESDCAESGSISPERFGRCHGEDQARVMIANFINRAYGRVSLRGVARVRHRLSQLPRAQSSTLLATRPQRQIVSE